VPISLSYTSLTSPGAEALRRTLAAVPERRAAFVEASEARLMHEAEARGRLLAEEEAAVAAVEAEEAGLERRQTLAAAAAAAAYETAVEECEAMKEQVGPREGEHPLREEGDEGGRTGSTGTSVSRAGSSCP
jgi:hypothetical protein